MDVKKISLFFFLFLRQQLMLSWLPPAGDVQSKPWFTNRLSLSRIWQPHWPDLTESINCLVNVVQQASFALFKLSRHPGWVTQFFLHTVCGAAAWLAASDSKWKPGNYTEPQHVCQLLQADIWFWFILFMTADHWHWSEGLSFLIWQWSALKSPSCNSTQPAEPRKYYVSLETQ